MISIFLCVRVCSLFYSDLGGYGSHIKANKSHLNLSGNWSKEILKSLFFLSRIFLFVMFAGGKCILYAAIVSQPGPPMSMLKVFLFKDNKEGLGLRYAVIKGIKNVLEAGLASETR